MLIWNDFGIKNHVYMTKELCQYTYSVIRLIEFENTHFAGIHNPK